MPTPVLEAAGVRIDVGGSPAVDGLSFATTGEHSLVLGAARALFEAAAGLRLPAHGEIRVRGTAAIASVRAAGAAGAPLDPPLPPRWTPREYAFWSARLVGRGRSEARELAQRAMDGLKLGPAADAPLGKAVDAVKRAAVVAGALATGAQVILLEDPTLGLAEDVSRNFARALMAALEMRAWVVFAGRMPLLSPLAMNADEAIVVSGSAVVAQGNPAELASRERAYALAIHGDRAAFMELISTRGARVTHASTAGVTVELTGDLEVRDLLTLARDAHATLLEVRPLSAALS